MLTGIETYALIGDGRTAALVSRHGSIDWLCLPRFDSAACLAALLGTPRNGFWKIAPCGAFEVSRQYQDNTLVLQTEFTQGSATVRLTDLMVVASDRPVLMRHLTALRGNMRLRCEVAFRFDYGLVVPSLRQTEDALIAIAGPDLVVLRGPVHLAAAEDQTLWAEFEISEGQSRCFSLCHGDSHLDPPAEPDPDQSLRDTLTFWRRWAARFRGGTRWDGAVLRSLLTLKALIHRPTGAMVAAPTMSLPEVPGGASNWDYRYCWVRDAAFTVSTLLNAGYREEAVQWRDWMLRAIAASPDQMRVLYRVDGDRRMYEQTVPWLSGFEGAVPVRVGNDAAAQEQTDIVGELLDALSLMQRAGIADTPDAFQAERDLIGHLEKTWRDKAHDLWEERDQTAHYTYSKVMSWVGIDCFLRGAGRHAPTDDAQLGRLRALREHIHTEVMARSWNHARGHLVDRYGGERLDASLLLLPLVGFLPADDPRMTATIDAIERELSQDGLVWRNPGPGDVREGAFIAASCWLADCRALQGRKTDAVALLERVLALRNDVGLLSEVYHPGLRQLMGNFPQALSHLALANSALGLSLPVLQRGGG
ncbi:glycoside hydrolase family 15 protein [Rhodopila sp.]|uniref:glycoside hydrolase family 15 protein n=1 Tax=Rhodopila sp. TaxID=2480087 RepID=UPI002CFAF5A0|nr:glycoside hydrolase family 15 protein [Rhodopila sp.]HVZ10302.1 glycoside hydrolase family 15 protein [Rhodopila sp.]